MTSCVSIKSGGTSHSTLHTPHSSLSFNDSQRLKYFYYEAMKLQDQGKFAAAFDLLKHCETIDPQAAEVYYAEAVYYAELNNDSMALACMKKAADLNPSNDTYLERLAITHVNSRQFDEAVNAYERLYANHKDRLDVLDILLQLYNQQKNYDKMLSTLELVESLEGSNERLALSKMRIYSVQGKKDKEYETLKELSDSHPNDMNYHVMMGNWLLQNDKDDEALEQYKLVLEEEPDHTGAKMSMLDYYRTTGADSLAQVLQEEMLISQNTPTNDKVTLMRQVVADNEQSGGDSTQVLSLFKRILAEPQKNADMYELYVAYMKLKQMPEDSINSVLEKALEVAPDNAGVRFQLVQSKWMSQDYDTVIALCEPATEYNPDEMTFYYFLGLAHFQKDERDKALDALRRGVAQINEESNKDFVSDFYAIMGQILHDKGLDDEAFAAYDSSLQWKDDNIEVLNNYAYFLSERGERLQKAEQMSFRTIKAEPTNSTYLDTYAWILFMQERYEEAKIYIDQAVQNDSVPNAVIIEHAGDIYALNKDMQKAVEYWKQAQEAGGNSKVLIRKIRQRKYLKR
ncbi:MAG: tetratricopeptide repeat protein [Prevotella sp.]|nr:tetratricopeptide repeat protein [Prevotella sp.]